MLKVKLKKKSHFRSFMHDYSFPSLFLLPSASSTRNLISLKTQSSFTISNAVIPSRNLFILQSAPFSSKSLTTSVFPSPIALNNGKPQEPQEAPQPIVLKLSCSFTQPPSSSTCMIISRLPPFTAAWTREPLEKIAPCSISISNDSRFPHCAADCRIVPEFGINWKAKTVPRPGPIAGPRFGFAPSCRR